MSLTKICRLSQEIVAVIDRETATGLVQQDVHRPSDVHNRSTSTRYQQKTHTQNFLAESFSKKGFDACITVCD